MIDFSLTEEQRMFREQARKFAMNEIRPAEIELDKIQDPVELFNSDIYHNIKKKIFQIGYPKLRIKEEYGGLGQSQLTNQIVTEELAVGGVGIAHSILPWGGIYGILASIAEATGDQELIKRFVLPFTSDTEGYISGCLCFTEPDFGSDALNGLGIARTFARKDGDDYVINGAKSQWVSNGTFATDLLVLATTDRNKGRETLATFIIPADTKGISRGRPADKIGERAKNQAEIFFDDVRIPARYKLMDSFTELFINNFLAMGNTNVGTCAVGLMRAAYEDALAYAKQRIQGGKPIFEHQLIAMKLFDAYSTIEASRAMLWKSGAVIDALIESGSSETGDIRLAVGARAFACNAAMRIIPEMVQVFGAYGLTKEYPVEKYLRDVKALQIADGTCEVLSLAAAQHLGEPEKI